MKSARQPTNNSHDTFEKHKIKTFTDMKKQKTSNKRTILKANHKLFGYMMLIANNRNLTMNKVLMHPFGPILRSFGNCGGILKKTIKTALT